MLFINSFSFPFLGTMADTKPNTQLTDQTENVSFDVVTRLITTGEHTTPSFYWTNSIKHAVRHGDLIGGSRNWIKLRLALLHDIKYTFALISGWMNDFRTLTIHADTRWKCRGLCTRGEAAPTGLRAPLLSLHSVSIRGPPPGKRGYSNRSLE